MCHTEVPAGQTTPDVHRNELTVTVGTGEEMPATLFSHGGGDAGILLIPDIHGPSPFYESLAARLAEAGFAVLLPDFFFRQGPAAGPDLEHAFARRGRLDEALTVRDLDAAVEWLRLETGSPLVGSLGFCMGATYGLDLASLREDMVTVAYYGFPVPQSTLVMPPPRPVDLVDDLSGPVLAFWGDQDHGVGQDTVHAYAALAAKANPGFSHEIVAGAGHGFLARARIDEAEDAGGATWQRTLAHFHSHLGQRAGQGPRR